MQSIQVLFTCMGRYWWCSIQCLLLLL